jgi:peptide/nickel transport system substrate-binding protein
VRAFHFSRRDLLKTTAAGAAAIALPPALVRAQSASSTPATSAWPPGKSSATPGPQAAKLLYGAYNVDQAPLNIQNGDMDLYVYGLKTAAARQLEQQPNANVKLIDAPSGLVDLLLNPAPAPQGQFNPFSVKEIRQAMQFLVDRNFIATTIYQGRATPQFSHVSPYDYDERTVFETVVGRNVHFDAEYAKGVITQQMQKAGAQLQNNVWTFNGQPIIIKVLIRVEDERRDIGDTVRNQLTSLGFQAQPLYQQFGPASLAVYSSDPITFQWHIYTEGWSHGTAVRYDSGSVNAFLAPWAGNMPGWQEVGFWQYEQPQLDKLGKQLFRGEFTSEQQRDDIYRQMTSIGLDESVRIWLVTQLQSFPERTVLQNVNISLGSGPQGSLALREASVQGTDQVKVGNLWVWTDQSVWNPVGGLSDLYSSNIAQNLIDSLLVTHPFTGLPMPFRSAYQVETAGPGKNSPVPADAVLWDATSHTWKAVGNGKNATSKVTYDLTTAFASTFHHGAPITMADLLYTIAQSFEFAYNPDKVQIEPALGVTARPYLETFAGFRIVDANHVEIYVNYWHFSDNLIASYAMPGNASVPWELLAAMDDVVFVKRQGAYTSTAAQRFQVPWISMVIESDARLVLRSIQQFQRQKSVPQGYFELNGRSLVSPDDATKRYEAAVNWFNQKNLLVIYNGPFQLTKFDAGAQFAELDAFREKSYPFSTGQWLFGPAPTLTIQAQPPASIPLASPIDIPVTVAGPGTRTLQYWLVDPTKGTVVAKGNAAAGEKDQFPVSIGADVTSKLFPGLYQLWLLASSDQMSQVAQQEIDLNVGI